MFAILLPLQREDDQMGQAMKPESMCTDECLSQGSARSPSQPAPLGQELESVRHVLCKTRPYADTGHPSIALGCWQTGRVLDW